ncbi:MAG: Multidrug resistance protein 3 [Candidatus Hinthialibacteria bacterium OLB16]|nr:MAG: Multidrug resistance protein 3 [Candidatus Hinthialibacteria bacterium OLB16]
MHFRSSIHNDAHQAQAAHDCQLETTESPYTQSILMTSKRRYVVFAVMLATFLAAVDMTIVDTALPRIVGSLGGFSMFTWLVTAYLLTSTALVPAYGKLADILGRKKVFTLGTVIFLLGSALCGQANDMVQLILFRGLQGLGAAGILPVVQTIIGDIYSPAERAKMQGWFSSVWGLSALLGPLVGGVIVDHFSWRWLFYINLPLGALALVMLHIYFDEKVADRQASVDYTGSAFLVFGISAFMLGLLEGGSRFAWTSPPILGLFACAAILGVLFIRQEYRHDDPILPPDLFRDRTIFTANLAQLFLGGVLYSATVYLPLWAQGVQGFSATRSGASLLWLSIGWPLASAIGGRVILQVGQRPAAILGLIFTTAGAAALLILDHRVAGIPEAGFGIVTFCIGSGMGFATLSFMLGVQSAVGWEQRGVATASLQFIRTLGGLIWVAIMGAVMNLTLAAELQKMPKLGILNMSQAASFANNLLDPDIWARMTPDDLTMARSALADSLRQVHWVTLLCSVIALLITLKLPNRMYSFDLASRASESTPVP